MPIERVESFAYFFFLLFALFGLKFVKVGRIEEDREVVHSLRYFF